jgi:hypothetical protein
MRRYYLLLCLLPLLSFAQYASVALSEENAKKLGEASRSAMLYVVINNEKDPHDAALVNAVKNYWKQGSHKFMSRTEFLNLKLKNELPKGLFLYEWFRDSYVDSKLDASQLALYLSKVKTGCYYLAAGDQKEIKTYSKGHTWDVYLSLKFDMGATLNSKKILDGYFDLMVKYFNNETGFCQKLVSVKDVKRENKDGIVYFGEGLSEVQTRNILLVKEQVNRQQAENKKEGKKTTPLSAVSQFNPPQKNVYTVFPDDIKMALSKNDKEVLLYSNGLLISAADGSVVAGPAHYGLAPAKKDWAFWLSVLAILLSSFVLATIMT